MFQKFLEHFEVKNIIIRDIDSYQSFLTAFSGIQFGNGLFTVFREEDIDAWQENVKDAFQITKEEVALFGYDWQGNCYGIAKEEKIVDKVVLFEIGTGDVLLSEGCFEDNIDNEAPYNAEACLAGQFYKKWLDNGGKPSKYGRCIGYKVPLFLGGKDDITNLEDSDMDVYWSILSQIMNQTGMNR